MLREVSHFSKFYDFEIKIISRFLRISQNPLDTLWGLIKSTHAPNLESISQSSTELWPRIGFDHIWRLVGHLELDDLKKTTLLFILRYLI